MDGQSQQVEMMFEVNQVGNSSNFGGWVAGQHSAEGYRGADHCPTGVGNHPYQHTDYATTTGSQYISGMHGVQEGIRDLSLSGQGTSHMNSQQESRGFLGDVLGQVIKQKTSDVHGVERVLSYRNDRIVGNGSFGVVFQATCLENGEQVAIKKVLQDRRFKNRELQMMKVLRHPNVVQLRQFFYCRDFEDNTYLHLVLELVPDTVYRIFKQYHRSQQRVPLLLVKLYIYQLARSLNYIHRMGICHRDIKPQNLLVDPQTHVLKLCDFGSAKVLVRGEPNISYICSRYYRAPELIFGASEYTTAIDIWSMGCVFGELLLGQPLFPGESSVDQLVEIIKVLGTPSQQEVEAMNPQQKDYRFPQIRPHPWNRIFRRVPQEGLDLIQGMLQYDPQKRLSAVQIMTHTFFDELRDANTSLPDGRGLPPVANWQMGELDGLPQEIVDRLQSSSSSNNTQQQS